MDAIKGIGDGIKKGVESVGNALDTASRASRGGEKTGSGNPVEKEEESKRESVAVAGSLL